MKTLIQNLQGYYLGFLSLAYPNICNGCTNTLRGAEEILCRKCTANLPRTGFEWSENNPANQSFWGRVPVNFAASVFYYRKGELLPKLIHQLKYKRRRDIGVFLGKITGKLLTDAPFFHKPDVIVPVPLHPRKLRSRGYNQCDILSQGISEVVKAPVLPDSLIRQVYNVSQTRKTRFERWENVEGIFKIANPQIFENKHILLVDDVITTGSTLEACCFPLNQITGTKISIITVGYSAR